MPKPPLHITSVSSDEKCESFGSDLWEVWLQQEGKKLLLSISRRHSFDREDSKELFQKLQIATWRSWQKYGSEKAKQLLGAVLKNCVINHLALRNTQSKYFQGLPDWFDAPEVLDTLPDMEKLLKATIKTGNEIAVSFIKAVQEHHHCKWEELYGITGYSRKLRDSAFRKLAAQIEIEDIC